MKRDFEIIKSQRKLEALTRWRSRDPITAIAEDLKVTRDTIYRWIRESESRLSRRQPRTRKRIDGQTRYRIIELYILLQKPSLASLSKKLSELYHLKYSQAQLKYWLKLWEMAEFSPSPFFGEILADEFPKV